jgi:hypothetical protein
MPQPFNLWKMAPINLKQAKRKVKDDDLSIIVAAGFACEYRLFFGGLRQR